MDKDEQLKSILNKLGQDQTLEPLGSDDLSLPKSEESKNALDEILEQRKKQREKVLNFIIGLTTAAFLLLMGLLIIQSAGRILIQNNFSLLDGRELEILSVSVFGQALGVIWLITRSLWDDKNYLNKITTKRELGKNG